MKKTYISLLPEFVITGTIIYTYLQRLILILQGEILPTTTGLDALLIELISVVFTIILISFWIIFFRSHKENFLKLSTHLLGLTIATGAIILLMIYSGEKEFLDPTLLYVLGGATLLKLVRYIKNRHDHAGAIRSILGYIFIYMGCFLIAMMVDLHIFDSYYSMVININDPVEYLDQSALRMDVLAALIYYFSIGFLGPIIAIIRQKKKLPLVQ